MEEYKIVSHIEENDSLVNVFINIWILLTIANCFVCIVWKFVTRGVWEYEVLFYIKE